MKVILIEDVLHLGDEGDICTVTSGFARNYLIPQKKALPHTPHTLSLIEGRRKGLEEKKKQKLIALTSQSERLRDCRVIIPARASESGRLFGSVSPHTVMEAFEKEGIFLEKKMIALPQNHLRLVGNYPCNINLHQDVSVSCRVEVVATAEEKSSYIEFAGSSSITEPVNETREESPEESSKESPEESP